MSEMYGDEIYEKILALESAHEAARDTYHRAIRNFYPDGLRVVVQDEFYVGQIIGEGVIVGMEPDSRLRVAIGVAAVLRVVPWSRLTPILPDKV